MMRCSIFLYSFEEGRNRLQLHCEVQVLVVPSHKENPKAIGLSIKGEVGVRFGFGHPNFEA